MGLFGSDSSSSSSSTSKQNVAGVTDGVSVNDAIGNQINTNLVNNYLDGNAIEKSFDFARLSSENQRKTMADVLNLTGDNVSKMADITSKGFGLARDMEQDYGEVMLNLADKFYSANLDTSKQLAAASATASDQIARAYQTANEKEEPLSLNKLFLIVGGVVIIGFIFKGRKG